MATPHSSTTADLDASSGVDANSTPVPLHPDIGILSLSVDPWSWRWNSRHQVLTRLARYFRVLWLNPAPEWRSAAKHPVAPARELTPKGQPQSFVVRDSASWMPVVYRPGWLASRLFRARIAAARNSLLRQGCRRIVLYIWHPDLAAALDAVQYDLSCYHIYDEYSNSDREKQQIDPQEEQLVRRTDLLFTVSRPMFAWKGALSAHSMLLSNGVDFRSFADPVPMPADLARVPSPRLGYAGFLKTQLDWELLSSLVARHPAWSFVFVGARREQPDIDVLIGRLEQARNVYFLGPKSTAELAQYPQHFDVCLMPYRMNSYSTYTYPLKLNEYLAGGRPIVSVPLPVLQDVGALVSTASTLTEWDTALTQALGPEECAPALRLLRQAEARRHDWRVIADIVAKAILHAQGADRSVG